MGLRVQVSVASVICYCCSYCHCDCCMCYCCRGVVTVPPSLQQSQQPLLPQQALLTQQGHPAEDGHQPPATDLQPPPATGLPPLVQKPQTASTRWGGSDGCGRVGVGTWLEMEEKVTLCTKADTALPRPGGGGQRAGSPEEGRRPAGLRGRSRPCSMDEARLFSKTPQRVFVGKVARRGGIV